MEDSYTHSYTVSYLSGPLCAGQDWIELRPYGSGSSGITRSQAVVTLASDTRKLVASALLCGRCRELRRWGDWHLEPGFHVYTIHPLSRCRLLGVRIRRFGGISECSKISHPAHIGPRRRAMAPRGYRVGWYSRQRSPNAKRIAHYSGEDNCAVLRTNSSPSGGPDEVVVLPLSVSTSSNSQGTS